MRKQQRYIQKSNKASKAAYILDIRLCLMTLHAESIHQGTIEMESKFDNINGGTRFLVTEICSVPTLPGTQFASVLLIPLGEHGSYA